MPSILPITNSSTDPAPTDQSAHDSTAKGHITANTNGSIAELAELRKDTRLRKRRLQSILIIEDEQAYVRLLRDTFEDKYHILTASNGKIGLRMARQHEPDLILLDHIMPEMDGMTVLAELRENTGAYGKNAKVIILTNLDATNSLIARSVKALPLYYFVKSDTSLEDLTEKVDEVLSEKPAGSE